MKREVLLSAVVLGLFIFVGTVFAALHIAPVFTWWLVSVCLAALLYILTEQWQTHHATEYENRFWTMLAFFVARTFLVVEDSPLKLPGDRIKLAYFLSVVFAFLAHNFDRHLRRLALSQPPKIRRVKSAEFPDEYRAGAAQKVLAIKAHLEFIDNKWVSSTFLNIFFLKWVLEAEADILSILADAHSDEMVLILQNLELPRLFYKVKDHRFARAPNRTKLLTLLGSERVGEMNVPARALMLDALQRMKLTAHPQCEMFVKNIICKTKADDLSELKCITDSKGDAESMHQLLYVHMKNDEIRDSILKYIAQQAKVQAAHTMLASKRGKERDRFAWRKILSDVDDTLLSSGGSWPAGMDTTYPHKAVYPGVLAFYRELDVGASLTGSEEWDESRDGNLVFLSARPHVYKSISEDVTYKKFKKLQEDRGLYTSPSLLAGSLDTGGEFMVKDDCEPLALQKFRNLKQYLSIYPEFRCIFVGDNGQGDVRTAEMVLQDPTLRNNLQRVYVHRVQELHKTHTKLVSTRTGAEGRKGGSDPHLCYFDTYIDAALDALEHNLIRASGLRRVMLEAKEDFEYIPMSLWNEKTGTSKTAVVSGKPVSSTAVSNASELSNIEEMEEVTESSIITSTVDVADAIAATTDSPDRAKIGGGGTVTPRQTSPLPRRFLTSMRSTPQPVGLEIDTGNDSSGTSVAATPERPLAGRQRASSNASAMNSSVKAAARTFTAVPIKKKRGVFRRRLTYVNRVVAPNSHLSSGQVRRELALRKLNDSIMRANKVLEQQTPPLPTVETLPYTIHSNLYIGAVVDTQFGRGEIVAFRPSDGIYEVDVTWDDSVPSMTVYVAGSTMTF